MSSLGRQSSCFRSEYAYTPKIASALTLIQQILARGEQVLIGSAFHEPLDTLSAMLNEARILHQVLDGVSQARAYFDRDTANEREIRETADALVRRADGQWALYGVPCNANGWPTETVEDVTIIHDGTPENASLAIGIRDMMNRY